MNTSHIDELRKKVWRSRSDDEKQNGTGWICLDYVAMNRIEELQEEDQAKKQQA